MTVDQLRTEWPHVRDQAKARWTQLSEDDLDQVYEDPHRLLDLLHERYGYSRPIVVAEVDHFLQRLELMLAEQ